MTTTIYDQNGNVIHQREYPNVSHGGYTADRVVIFPSALHADIEVKISTKGIGGGMTGLSVSNE
jgi:hypothetical protein